MTRFNDWPQRLEKYFIAYGTTKFEFGVNDCATFTSGTWNTMTGVNLLEGVEYRDSSDVEALTEAAVTKHGLRERDSRYHAQRGDIVLYQNLTDKALGVAALDGKSIVILADGLIQIKLARALKAWGI